MVKDVAEFLSNVLKWAGVDHELYEGYSGRGMYGEETYGIVLDDPTVLMVTPLQYVVDSQVDFDDIPDDIICCGPGDHSFSIDSMGLSKIVY